LYQTSNTYQKTSTFFLEGYRENSRSPIKKYAYSYTFGFNGQEKVNEIAGVGNHNTAKFGELETRLGRRWNIDPKPNTSTSNYSVLSGNPIKRTDPFGDTDNDDIVFKGSNDKEIRIAASGDDKVINLPVPQSKNGSIDLGLANVDPNKFAYGYTTHADFNMGLVGAGQWRGLVSVVNFTSNEYSGYNYVYAGGQITASFGAQLSFAASAGFSVFVAYNTSEDFGPKTFSGKFYAASLSQDLKEIVGGGYTVSAFSGTPGVTSKGWKGFSVGINVGVGESVNLASIGNQISNTILLNDVKPTSERSFLDILSNRVAPIKSSVASYVVDQLLKK
jgi:hypothetical protein